MGTIHTRFVWWPSVIIVSLTLDVICLAETRDPFHVKSFFAVFVYALTVAFRV